MNFCDGRPTDPQTQRDVRAGEGAGRQAGRLRHALVAKDLAAANKSLAAKKLDAIKLMSHEEWGKKEPGSGTPAATMFLPRF